MSPCFGSSVCSYSMVPCLKSTVALRHGNAWGSPKGSYPSYMQVSGLCKHTFQHHFDNSLCTAVYRVQHESTWSVICLPVKSVCCSNFGIWHTASKINVVITLHSTYCQQTFICCLHPTCHAHFVDIMNLHLSTGTTGHRGNRGSTLLRVTASMQQQDLWCLWQHARNVVCECVPLTTQFECAQVHTRHLHLTATSHTVCRVPLCRLHLVCRWTHLPGWCHRCMNPQPTTLQLQHRHSYNCCHVAASQGLLLLKQP